MSPTNDPPRVARELRRYRPLARVIAMVGPPPIQRRHAPSSRYPYLVRSIVHQQLAGSAAAAIHARLEAGCAGSITPEAVDSLSEDDLISFGLSGPKRAAIRDLTAQIDSGAVRLERHARWNDQQVEADLVKVRGIGPWTAQMYMMSSLGRVDVWPTGDFGVRHGWSVLHDLDTMITPKDLETAGAPLAPHRSAVAWYCWKAVDIERAGGW